MKAVSDKKKLFQRATARKLYVEYTFSVIQGTEILNYLFWNTSFNISLEADDLKKGAEHGF